MYLEARRHSCWLALNCCILKGPSAPSSLQHCISSLGKWEARLARSPSLSVCLVVVLLSSDSCLGWLRRLGSTPNQLSIPRSLLHFFSCLGGALGSISLPSMAQPVLPRLRCIARLRFHFCFSFLVCHMTVNHTREALNSIEPYTWVIRRSHGLQPYA